MALRYERDGEIIPNAVKRNGRNSREANRPTGTEKARTKDTVEGMAVDVETAKEQAQQAIDDAANALTTSSGKNARRRGQTEPEPPPGGWVQGDQWIVDNDDGKPVEVRVWDGDEFVFEQVLAAELLVVSGGGVVRLADGVVTADAIAADAIDGMIITGATVQGGVVRQEGEYNKDTVRRFTVPRNIGAFTTSWTAPAGTPTTRSYVVPMDNTLPGWTLPNQPPPEVQSRSFEIGLRWINPATSLYENRTQVRIPDDFPSGVEVTVSVWACAIEIAKTATIRWHDGTTQNVNLTLGQWTKLSHTGVRSQEFVEIVNSVNFYPYASNSLAVADITFESSEGAIGRSELVTTDDGPALVFSSGADVGSLVEIGRVSPTELVIADTVINSDGITVEDEQAIASSGALILAGQTVRVIGAESTAFEGPVTFDDTVAFPGDTDWANVTLASGFVIQSGLTWQWRVKAGWLQMKGRIGRSGGTAIGASFVAASVADSALAAAAASVAEIVKHTPAPNIDRVGLLRIMANGSVQIASSEVAFFPNVEFLL